MWRLKTNKLALFINTEIMCDNWITTLITLEVNRINDCINQTKLSLFGNK